MIVINSFGCSVHCTDYPTMLQVGNGTHTYKSERDIVGKSTPININKEGYSPTYIEQHAKI